MNFWLFVDKGDNINNIFIKAFTFLLIIETSVLLLIFGVPVLSEMHKKSFILPPFWFFSTYIVACSLVIIYRKLKTIRPEVSLIYVIFLTTIFILGFVIRIRFTHIHKEHWNSCRPVVLSYCSKCVLGNNSENCSIEFPKSEDAMRCYIILRGEGGVKQINARYAFTFNCSKLVSP